MLEKLAVVLLVTVSVHVLPSGGDSHFLNEWVAHIDGGVEVARDIAKRYGFQLLAPMRSLDSHYVLKHTEVPHRSKRSADHHTNRLLGHSDVKWAEQQFIRNLVKRTIKGDGKEPARISTDTIATTTTTTTTTASQVYEVIPFNDPYYPKQWYLVNGTLENPHLMSLQAVWAKNYTGTGIVVSVVDDGLEHNNTDIQPNYDAEASFDLNENDTDPMPRYDKTNSNKHGTRCAGEIAMVANNSFCGVGIAYKARLGGIKLLDGNITDRMEAEALGFRPDHINIYSLSWGPSDDGKTVDGPHQLSSQAMEKAIRMGRRGKGVIYVLASGNGGLSEDNCNCDGYAGSPYTISVSSATAAGKRPWYGELCPSSLTTTYSSGTQSRKSVVGTDLHNLCTAQHTGTSASAPLVAGIVALVLEANPDLTWRDVQHLVVVSSIPDPLLAHDKENWYWNAACFRVNLAFGFGVLDPQTAVSWAERWVNVDRQAVCETIGKARGTRDSHRVPRILRSGGGVTVTFDTDGCRGTENEIRYLEHVQFVFTMNYTVRGAIRVRAKSPSGTWTTLLAKRHQDLSTDSYVRWPLTSVHWWGESAQGTWCFTVDDNDEEGANSGVLKYAKLVMYGTKGPPFYQHLLPSSCDRQESGDSEACE